MCTVIEAVQLDLDRFLESRQGEGKKQEHRHANKRAPKMFGRMGSSLKRLEYKMYGRIR